MDSATMIFFGSIAGAICLIVFVCMRMFAGGQETRLLRDRLKDSSSIDKRKTIDNANGTSPSLINRIGQAAAQPFMPTTREKQSGLRKQLGYAGLYAPSTIRLVTGFKVILMGLGLGFGYVAGIFTDQ